MMQNKSMKNIKIVIYVKIIFKEIKHKTRIKSITEAKHSGLLCPVTVYSFWPGGINDLGLVVDPNIKLPASYCLSLGV